MSKKKKEWRAEKERLLSLGLEDRRKEYSDNYKALDKIPTWRECNSSSASAGKKEHPETLSDKVSLHKGDITILEVDAIVNAANSSLLGGGGVDGCIHRAAGHFLYDECHSLNGCETGKAKITCGYDLPAKYVIHTVGPIARGNVGHSQREALKSCYNASLQLVKDLDLRSVAFPCISTGIYGFPNEPAADIALNTVRDWLKDNKDKIDRIIFCVFLENDYGIYQRKMSEVFSPGNEDEHEEVNTAQAEDESKMGDTEDVNMMSQEETDKKHENDIEMASQEGSNGDMNAETQSQEPENGFPVAEKEEAKEAAPEHSVSVRNEEAAGESKNMDVKEEKPVEEKGGQEDGAGAEKETMEEKTPAADLTKEEENEQTENKESQGLKEGTEPKGTPIKEPNTAAVSSVKDNLDDDTGHEDGTPEEPNLVTNKDNIQPKDGPAEQSELKE